MTSVKLPESRMNPKQMEDTTPLWTPSNPESTQMFLFKQAVEGRYNVTLSDYHALHQWSIKNTSLFWQEIWDYTGIVASTSPHSVLDETRPMFPRPSFFPGAKLNFAENLLFPRSVTSEESPAIFAATELGRETVSWKDLRDRVRRCAAAMKAMNVKANDRVAGLIGNHVDALVIMLSATSLGAIWTGVSPDTGAQAVLDRLQQIEPVLLFVDNATLYNGKIHDMLEKGQMVANKLSKLQATIILKTVKEHSDEIDSASWKGKTYKFEDFEATGDPRARLDFSQLPPDHPVYILYSSGTTGKPKCIIHGAIGTLIQHKKEHMLHCDIRPDDRLFYFTTCTWMMWHWLVSGLASGATLILYDGSPFRPFDIEGKGDFAMPRLIDEFDITHFGTSAKYLSLLEQKNVDVRSQCAMTKLRAIYSTAAPLAPSTFKYVYRAFGPNVHLASITGGTDIVSLFGAPSPLDAVYEGEIQVCGLGMAVEAWDYTGENVGSLGEPGDLVCTKPFPCQPIAFWGPNGDRLYQKSYFESFPGVWHHGDFIRFNPRTGGLIMLGRSDGVLKPAGVRFGSAEIYNVLLQHFPIEVSDALCVGRRRSQDADETVVLFIKMELDSEFSEDLVTRIKSKIRSELSARHIPGIVEECPEVPVTVNGKKVEVAVKQILCGLNIKTTASVANVECLDWYREWAHSH